MNGKTIETTLIAATLLTACAPPPPPPAAPAPTATATASAPPEATATATAEALVVEEPIRDLQMPTAACRLTAENAGGLGVEFKLSPRGAVFARAGLRGGVLGVLGAARSDPSSTTLEALLFEGDGRSAGVIFETKQIRVRGHVDTDGLQLRAIKPVVLGGFIVASGASPLRVSSTGVDARPDLGGEADLEGDVPAWHLACADLTLSRATPDLRSLVPGMPKKPKEMDFIPMGSSIDLSLKPGGPPVARLHPTEESPSVLVLEKKGNATRIAWDVGSAMVFGWVSSATFGTLSRPAAEGRMSALPAPEPVLSRVVCDKDVALIAELSPARGDDKGDRAVVGAVKAGALMDILERTATLARISRAPKEAVSSTAPVFDLTPAPRAKLWVRVAEIASCPSQAPAKEKAP